MVNILGILSIGCIFAILGNSIADRIPKNQSIISPGPYCKWCAVKLSWKEFIPIWGYLRSKGKCPYCDEPIPVRNLILDLTAILWVAIFVVKFGWGYQSILEMMFGMGLITIIVIELENRQLSNPVLLILGMLSAMYLLAFNFTEFPMASLSFLIGAGILLIYNLSKTLTRVSAHIDFSEIKFGALLGLFLGFPEILLCIFLAIFTSATISSLRIQFQRKSYQNAIPDFPVIMAVSTLLTIMFGQEIISLYMSIVA